MNWYLCKNKKNQLLAVNEEAREILNSSKTLSKEMKPLEVVECFDSFEELEKHFEEMNKVDGLIESVLKN